MSERHNYNLFLDDVRAPADCGNYVHWSLRDMYRTEEWKIARDMTDFIFCIERFGIPAKVSFDHDLADEHYEMTGNESYETFTHPTGLSCAKFLAEKVKQLRRPWPEIFVHSMNPVGKENIINFFKSLDEPPDIAASFI